MKLFLKKFWRIAKANPLSACGIIPVCILILSGVVGFIYKIFTDINFAVIIGLTVILVLTIFASFDFATKFDRDEE